MLATLNKHKDNNRKDTHLNRISNDIGSLFSEGMSKSYQLGWCVLSVAIYKLIERADFDAKMVKEYIIKAIEDDKFLKEIFYEIMKD